MRFVPLFLFTAIAAMAAISTTAPALASGEIAAEPSVITPGQAVTLRWYFTGRKVTVSGGRFGKGTIVTGRSSLTDRPTKTTRYLFDVWYRDRGDASGTKPGNGVGELVHQRYSVLVEVLSGKMPALTRYLDPLGWSISYQQGWKYDHVKPGNPGGDHLFFFQEEDDSIERLAVAVLPAGDMTCEALMEQVRADIPRRYIEAAVEEPRKLLQGEKPALYTTFRGIDATHPGMRTQSIVLTLVHGAKAYVISARTPEARYKSRQPVLERMVRSFAVAVRRTDSKSRTVPDGARSAAAHAE